MDQDKKTPVPRSSGEGKLWIKLKINPVKFEQGGAQADAEDHRIGPQRNDEPRVCNVCNKGFSSGKALGGHMRVHVQANKELKTNSSSTNDGRSSVGGCGVGGGKTICSLCGKDFPSMKSLFGHMRCHPEREWRGIQPPPQAKNSPISSSVSDPESEQFQHMADEDSVTDLTESLPSWCVKAKRGRKGLVTEEEKLFDAVEDLMRLAQGDSLESGLTHKNRVDGYDFEAEKSNSLIEIDSKKRRIQEKDCCHPVKKLRMDERGPTHEVKKMEKLGKGKAPVLKNEYMEKSVDESDGEKSGRSDSTIPCEEQLIVSYKYRESTNTKKKRKKLKLRDVESVRESNLIPFDDQVNRTVETVAAAAAPPDKYKCSTCSKCFPTHQALGGHRSSHNKVRIISQNMDESSIAAGEGTGELEANPMSRAEAKKEDEGAGSLKPVLVGESNHQCKICNKVFPTGQALGGHKRCHWTGSADQVGVPNQAGSPGEASQTGQRKILEIDLNELPATEDEEDGYDYYASNSSHASVG
ncbi:hypothetical protein RHMOL_Rhmol06G0318000 [Rhododendron molle]|uniref:Uncharacterized protein n=1 Tax=Rhododendron molle TaxID=49168 RepID=A0ACC0NJV3_RHOML|nr:hypothetical protein RHMOL_Rhmol06G0318000 [Rhododendron molle]